jgi:hypothetical protein
MNTEQMKKDVLNKVSIPVYFYNIILPNMDGYFDTYPVHFEVDPRACCPLHDEDTPSFRYYEATSSFYCFGCQRGGNVINLHIYFAEKLNGTKPTKEDAISFLYNHFIKGKISTEFISQANQRIEQEVRLNSDTEIVRFNFYRNNLERQVTNDRQLKFSVKKQLWELLDLADVLLSKNKIKTTEAETFIKQRVAELIVKDAFNERIMK